MGYGIKGERKGKSRRGRVQKGHGKRCPKNELEGKGVWWEGRVKWEEAPCKSTLNKGLGLRTGGGGGGGGIGRVGFGMFCGVLSFPLSTSDDWYP